MFSWDRNSMSSVFKYSQEAERSALRERLPRERDGGLCNLLAMSRKMAELISKTFPAQLQCRFNETGGRREIQSKR